MEEVPFPSPQRPHILMQLSPTQNILLSHPHDSPLPKRYNQIYFENCEMSIFIFIFAVVHPSEQC